MSATGKAIDRLLLRRSRQVHGAAHRLQNQVVTSLIALRTRLTKTGDGSVDKVRVACQNRGISHTKPVRHTGAEVFNHYVGAGRNRKRQTAACD